MATTRLLEGAIRICRNRKGVAAATEMRLRWRHEIAVALQRRKAAMIRSCLPKCTARRSWLSGEAGGRPDIESTLPAIEEVLPYDGG